MAASLTTTVTVNSVSYEITTVTGTFDELGSFLSQDPWFAEDLDFNTDSDFFSDSNLAFTFAAAVGSQLGTPNSKGNLGPYFAYGTSSLDLSSFPSVVNVAAVTGPFITNADIDPSTPATYAVLTSTAEAIPTPALLPGLIGMGLAAWRKRQQDTSDAAA